MSDNDSGFEEEVSPRQTNHAIISWMFNNFKNSSWEYFKVGLTISHQLKEPSKDELMRVWSEVYSKSIGNHNIKTFIESQMFGLIKPRIISLTFSECTEDEYQYQ